MQINRFPVWVISRVECPAIRIELIREHQHPLVVLIHIRFLRIYVFGRITIYEAKIAWNFRNLPCRIDSPQIEAALCCLWLGEEVR